jgi:hypothetical protein
MTTDRTVRSLAQLERSGSTARVLNLNAIAQRAPPATDGQAAPLFHHHLLNRCIVIKHRLRSEEQELFGDYRLLATKVVLPIDSKDLAAGAHYFFIGQRGYSDLINKVLGPQAKGAAHDRMVLQILDDSSTLDPFVLREHFRRNGLEPAPHYFDIGAGDLNRMQSFVVREVELLAKMTSNDLSGDAMVGAAKLARKLLSSKADVETEPLRHTLKLDLEAYKEGVFCWKGFLYYKWCLEELNPHISEVANEFSRIKLRGAPVPEIRGRIEMDRARLRRVMAAACESIRATIGIYDKAYRELVEHQGPMPFREFLLSAPALFCKLGDGLGAIQHIVSYWRFRFPPASRGSADPLELSEMLEDFLQVLSAFDHELEDEVRGRSESVFLV